MNNKDQSWKIKFVQSCNENKKEPNIKVIMKV